MRVSCLGTAVAIVILNALQVAPAPRPQSQIACVRWSLAADFRGTPAQANPNPDGCGNHGTWSYMQGGHPHDPTTYTLLPEFVPNAVNIAGLQQWQGTYVSLGATDKLPAVGVNTTGRSQHISTFTWPAQVARVHPGPSAAAIVRWRSPTTGALSITGGVTSLDPTCGNGIAWSIDKGAATLASGSIPRGGSQDFHYGSNRFLLSNVYIRQGESLYLVVDAKGDYGCDSTGVDLRIALLQPPPPVEFTEQRQDRLFGLPACPDGYAVVGVHARGNKLLCRRFGLGPSDAFVDYSTVRSQDHITMHACPDGTYARGYNDDRNLLICAYDIDRGYTVFSGSETLSPPHGRGAAPVRARMHACSNTDLTQVVVGVQADKNVFLCRSLPPEQPVATTSINVPQPFQPDQPRGLVKMVAAGMRVADWQTMTRNWLSHILNVPLDGQDNDPRCVLFSGSPSVLQAFNEHFGTAAASNAVCAGRPHVTIQLVELKPVPVVAIPVTRFGNLLCSAPAAPGVQRFLVRYRSPVMPNLTAPTYIMLPPGYTPAGSYPAVLVTHGHVKYGKESTGRCENYPDHANALALAAAGAVTMAPDTISFNDYETGESDTGNFLNSDCWSTDFSAHYEAACAVRVGTFMQRYLLDNIVRISIIRHIGGVDPARVSTAGLSLGGYQALWTAALDTRVNRVVVAGLFELMELMESSALNHRCQIVPSISMQFVKDTNVNHPNMWVIDPKSLLLTTQDLAGLIFPHALLSTWGTKDPNRAHRLTGQSAAVAQLNAVIALTKKEPFSFKEMLFSGLAHEFVNCVSVPFLLGVPAPKGFDTPCPQGTVTLNAATATPGRPVNAGITISPGTAYTIDSFRDADSCHFASSLACSSHWGGAANAHHHECTSCSGLSAPSGILVGRIGVGPYFAIGSHKAFTTGPHDRGTLYLAYRAYRAGLSHDAANDGGSYTVSVHKLQPGDNLTSLPPCEQAGRATVPSDEVPENCTRD